MFSTKKQIVYKHRHYRKKMNITFFEDDTKVSFQEMSTYYFDRTQSVAGLHDYNITVINLALMVSCEFSFQKC